MAQNKVWDQDGIDLAKVNWDGDKATDGLPVSGRLVEQYVKHIDEKATPTDEIASGEGRAVTSGAVADALTGTVTNVDVRDSDDGTQYVMEVKKKDAKGGEQTEEVRFSKYTDDAKVVVNVDLTDATGATLPASQYLKLGAGLVVKYQAGVGTAGGGEVESYSDLQVRVVVKRGATVMSAFQNAEYTGVTAGQAYTVDVGQWLKDAQTYTVQVDARATVDGQIVQKTATARVTMVAMELDTSYHPANGTSEGGWRGDVSIAMTAKGTTGEKNIYYRVNGGPVMATGLSSGSATQSKNIVIRESELKAGHNVVEAYALHEDSGVMSEVHYLSVLKGGSGQSNWVGMQFKHKADGMQSDWRSPVLRAEQFTGWRLEYACYDVNSGKAEVELSQNGTLVKTDLLQRGTTGTYERTNVNTDALTYELRCGSMKQTLRVETVGHADIEARLSADAVCDFDAWGRSNSEANAASWKSGAYEMKFNDVLWAVNEQGAGSGWNEGELLLTNGASMKLTKEGGFRPFKEEDKPEGQTIAETGMTIEIEYETKNVTDTGAELIRCTGVNSEGRRYGLVVTAEEALFMLGVQEPIKDDEGKNVIGMRDVSVGTKFEPGKKIKITYVFYPNQKNAEQRTLVGFYVNGEESGANKWYGAVTLDIDSELEFLSKGADLGIKRVRIYNKALTDDEVLDNYIVDRGHLEDTTEEKGVRTLDEENRVLSEGQTVSMDKLLGFMKKRKNSVLVIIGTGSPMNALPSDSDTVNVMDALAQLNDKKADKLAKEVRFYNGEDHTLDFIARNVYVRIQGTSSVNYARKNLRFYWQKTAEGYVVTISYGEIDGNGQQTNPVVSANKKGVMKLRRNSVGAKLGCAKTDFSDSSMASNLGGARLINDGLKEMGLLTPAQAYAKDHPDTCNEEPRSAIDGLPCDLFVAKSVDDDLVYYGQYNLNNDKSKSNEIFGQGDCIGGEKWGEGDTLNYLEADESGQKNYLPICYETLNNSASACLFQWLPSTEAGHTDFMDNNFDAGLEFNYPEDYKWTGAKTDSSDIKKSLGSDNLAERMYKATDRMMSFVYRCVKETPAGRNLKYNTAKHTFEGVDYTDDGGKFPSAKWKSATFRKEASKYFHVEYCLAYYMYVDLNLAVDQLAKNILLRTWDGRIWYTTYYDGDCQHGDDNKSYLTGKYDDGRQTAGPGGYVMQGHNSWLWNLMLANFRDVMEELMTKGYKGGTPLMNAFSVQKVKDYFIRGQVERWCERLYNKSGIFKYIYPYLNDIEVMAGSEMVKKTYAEIYGMKGSRRAHRSYFVTRRYNLKQVEYGYVATQGARLYQSTRSMNAGRVLQPLEFRLTMPYRLVLAASNAVKADSGVVSAEEQHTLRLTESYVENDPLTIVGAGTVKELVWHEDAFASGVDMSLFSSLVKLDMSVGSASGYRNDSYMTGTKNMALLEELDMHNNELARNGSGGSFAVLDLSYQARLRSLDVRGTGLERLTLATGAPIETLRLPRTLTELQLEHLTKLTDEGLELEGVDAITGYRFENCPLVDGWALLERLHEAKQAGRGRLERFRIEVDMEDDGTVLSKYYDYKTYTSTGAMDNQHSGLRGRVKLTRFLSDQELAKYQTHYPLLEIVQPEYTMLESDDSVQDDANITNLDNQTGLHGTKAYAPSGHITAILSKRHRVLAKVTKKATQRSVTMAGQSVAVNNLDGEMTYFPLDDSDSYKYADGSDAKLDGSEGDWMMYEPFYWSKGINDYLGQKHYSCYCSNDRDHMPSTPHVDVLSFDDIKRKSDGYVKGRKIMSGKDNLAASYSNDANYSVCKVDVSKHKRVRFPSVPGTNLMGAVFVDDGGQIVSSVVVPTLNNRFEAGMYLITDVPAGAKSLHFTILNTAEFDCVVLSNSDRIEDMEPEWVANDEHLCAVVGSTVVGSKLRAAITGGSTTASMTWTDFHFYSVSRGMQQIDALMHFRVANLFYAKYGRRDSQEQCGAGQHTNNRTTGGTAKHGMIDTIGYEEARSVNPNVTNSMIENLVHQYAWYHSSDSYGAPTATQVNNTCCLGYEDIYGHKYDMMDNVDLPNTSGNAGKWRIWMPDGSTRMVKGMVNSGWWIVAVAHGKHMDVVPVGNVNGSSSTNYCDIYYISTATSRVVYRGYNNANAYGGVSSANAGYDASNSVTVVGSRLAFRGQIVKAQSVAAYKAIVEVA